MQRPKTTPSRGAPARPVGTAESEAARRMRRGLAAADVPQFRHQVQIGSYTVDFVSPGAKLIIEVGTGEAGYAAAGRPERRRASFLEARGYRILRFSNEEVMEDLDRCVAAVADAAASPGSGRAPEASRAKHTDSIDA